MNLKRQIPTVSGIRDDSTNVADCNTVNNLPIATTTMFFDSDDYKATKRSLGHSEDEIALELKRLQTYRSCNNTTVLSLGRSSSKKLRLHCSKIDFNCENNAEYTVPVKYPKNISNLHPEANDEDIIKNGCQIIISQTNGHCHQEEETQVTKESSDTCQSNVATVTPPLPPKSKFQSVAQRFGYDFTYHAYLCLGILVAFLIWAVIYFPAIYILRSNNNKVLYQKH